MRAALVVVLLLVLAAPASAKLHPGFELGVNVAALQFEDMDVVPRAYWDTAWRPTFTGGFTLDVPVNERLALRTGLRYVQQGNRVHFDDHGGLTATFTFAQHYVSLPLLLSLRPLPSERISFSFGPELALLVAAETSVEEANFAAGAKHDDIKDSLESGNVTFDLGAGYEFPLQGRTGTLGVRYTQGVTNVAKKGDWLSGWKTQGIEALVGMHW